MDRLPVANLSLVHWGTVACVVLPWLWPFAGGPSSAILPWLVSCASFALLLLIYALRATDIRQAIVHAWLIAALVSSLIGLLQYFGFSPAFKPWVNVTPLGEAFANLRQRNQFATLTNLGLAVLIWVIQQCRLVGNSGADDDGLHPRRYAAIGFAVVAALLASANAATGSRTGLLQLVLLVLVTVMWRQHIPWRSKMVVTVAVSSYVVAALVLPVLAGLDPLASGIASRFGEPELPCAGRLLLWSNVLHLIALKPWTGWGWGELDFAHFVTLYPAGQFCAILDNAHNLPLHLAVELGIPVAVAVCGAMLWLVLRARPWREDQPQRQLAWAVLALIGLHSLLEYPLWYGPFQIAVVLAVWILWRTPAPPAPSADSSGVALQPPLPASVAVWVGAAAILVLCAIAYAAWDYHRVSQIFREPAQRASAYRVDTLAKVRDSWLFRNQFRFAELTLTRVTPANAESINRSAHALLHFSPEARVVEKLIDSALLLGKTEEAVFFMRRMRVAYPEDYAQWRDTREPVADLPVIDP